MSKTKYLFISILILLLAAISRLWNLNVLPVSLYWEEVALGYDAYSISLTGKDHHGNSWPGVAFESFGDWKPSGYFYVLALFIKAFGLSAWGVRMPAALAGIMLVFGSGLLAANLFPELEKKYRFSLWVMFLAAISNWGIMFSRAGWEVMLASSVLVWGTLLFRKFVFGQKFIFGLVGLLLLIFSMYTYHATRLIVPVLGLYLLWEWIQNDTKKVNQLSKLIEFVLKNKFKIGVFAFVSLVAIFPLLVAISSPVISQRFSETSKFATGEAVQLSNSFRENNNSILSKLFFHRYVFNLKQIIFGYFDHLNLNFLFLTGDSNLRHSTTFFGLFYLTDSILLLLGLLWLAKNFESRYLLLVIWLVVGLLPASISTASPHALRILPTFPIWQILLGLGLIYIMEYLSKHKKEFAIKFVVLFILISFLNLAWFWYIYNRVYMERSYLDWQYGSAAMVERVLELQTKMPEKQVFISRWQGRPSMYYFFYSQQPPSLVQAENSVATKDQSEFLEYKNISFVDKLSAVEADSIVALSAQEYIELTHHDINSLEKLEVVWWENKPIWVITTFPRGLNNEK